MSMRLIQRRLNALEAVMADALAPEYPALTPCEMRAIAWRFHSGAKVTRTMFYFVSSADGKVVRSLVLERGQPQRWVDASARAALTGFTEGP